MADKGWGIRTSQIVTTCGVGAMVTAGVESLMVMGIDQWPEGPSDLHEPRLEKELRVDGFRRPPTLGIKDVPVVRFPSWVSCTEPTCDVGLQEHRKLAKKHENDCPTCGGALVPSRFIVACRRGHIDDFPYWRWVHTGSQPTSGEHVLTMEARGVSSALRDVEIKCSCGKSQTMEGSFSRNALRGIYSCRGRRPWLPNIADEPCDQEPRVLQRGGSNVWYPVVRSSLSIPPWSEGVFKVLNRNWPVFRYLADDALPATIQGMHANGEFSGGANTYSVEDLIQAVRRRKALEDPNLPQQEVNLRVEEFEALEKGRLETGPRDEFVCEPPTEVSHFVSNYFSKAMIVKRLLEIRAITAFTRILPPSPADGAEVKAKLSAEPLKWLPAIDVIGEGVFLRLDEDKLRAWEQRTDVKQRVGSIAANYALKFTSIGAEPDRQITPRLVLTHSLAHAIINQWALDSGYAASSLRERLYVGDEFAGFLIYTATSDSAGSLGGVVEQAEAQKLEASLREALHRAGWCSADPICIEAEATGVDSLNRAACHACLLLPEVSCEEMNLLLDRALIAGVSGNPSISFFER